MNKEVNKKGDLLGKYLPAVIVFIIALISARDLLGDDFPYFFKWYLVLLMLSACAFPVAVIAFRKFHDCGYIFSKPLGIAFSGLLMWLLSSLHIAKFTRTACYICVVVMTVISVIIVLYQAYICRKHGKQALNPFNNVIAALPFMVRAEAVFFAIFVFWCYMKGFNPSAYGTEKFMDYGFMSVMFRSDYMPATDLWFSGEPINYYYVGQYLATYVTKLAGTGVGYGYNLMLMTLASLAFSEAYSLVYNLLKTFMADKDIPFRTSVQVSDKKRHVKKAVRRGLYDDLVALIPALGGTAAGLADSVAGNMHYFIYAVIVPLIQRIRGKETASYWFPDATRYIGYNPDTTDKTIHEFPCYSFVLGDLHAHVLNIMFVMTVLAVLFSLLLDRKEDMDNLRAGHNIVKPSLFHEAVRPAIIIIGIFIGIFHMTNYWDFPIYFVVAGAVILFSNAVIYQFNFGDTFKLTLAHALIILDISILVALPFTINFNQISTKICLCTSRTPLYQLAVLWGLPISAVLVYAFGKRGQFKREGLLTGCGYSPERGRVKKKIVGTSLNSESTMPESADADSVIIKFRPKKPVLFQYIENLTVSDLFVITIGLCAIGLIFLPEIIYVKDIYSGDYKRANTMFKLTYQAYIMFGICLGYILVRMSIYSKRKFYNILGVIMSALFITTLGYFHNSCMSWFGDIKLRENYKTLDSSAFLYTDYIDSENNVTMADDAAAIEWLNENVKGTPVVLEANGDSYTYYERISVFTGLPTVLGWRTHEWLWRSTNSSVDFPQAVADRETDVQTIYTSTDEETVKKLLEKYDVAYIVVGYNELNNSAKWGDTPVNEDLLKSFGSVVFSSDTNGNSPIYIIKVEL